MKARQLVMAIAACLGLTSCMTKTVDRDELHLLRSEGVSVFLTTEERVPQVHGTMDDASFREIIIPTRELIFTPRQVIREYIRKMYSPDMARVDGAAHERFAVTILNGAGLRRFALIDNGKQISPAAFCAQTPARSADGRRLLFCTKDNPGSRWNVWLMQADGSAPTQLAFGRDADWLSEEALIFSGPNGKKNIIWQINTDGSHRNKMIDIPNVDLLQPAVSPDGSRIAYVRQRDVSPTSRDIWVYTPATGTHRQITRHPARDDSPVWGPDGRSIYFRSTRNGYWSIWQIEAGPPSNKTQN